MLDKEFLSKLSILYVEDEAPVREVVSRPLSKLCKNAYVAEDGVEGLKLFKENKDHIDIILSDINMPNMNGMEMLKHIRDIDEDVPFIFATARADSEYPIQAIDLNVNHYILKPIDVKDLITKIQKICEQKFYENKFKNKQKEIKRYLNAINNVAVVFKMYEDGQITFVNQGFLEISKFTKEEALSLNFNNIIHPSIPTNYLDETWDIVKANKVWEGNTKFLDKDQESFYINSTIFKISNDEKDEYITIGFLTTKESIEKREFKKKVIKNIQESNKKEATYKEQINGLNEKINELEKYLPNIHSELNKEREDKENKNRQLNHYEMQMHNVEEKHQEVLIRKGKEIESHLQKQQQLKQEKEILYKKFLSIEEALDKIEIKNASLDSENEKLRRKVIDLTQILDNKR